MPTPDEDNVVPPTPPNDLTSSRTSFASCPPEEEREAHAPREARAESTQPASTEVVVDDGHAIRQVATPEPDVQIGGSREDGRDGEKAEHVEDAGIVLASDLPLSPSSSPPDAGSDSDGRLAQTLATTALDPSGRRKETEDDNAPLYLYYPPADKDRLQPHSTTSFLRSGSKFKGTQTSDRQVYDVQVEIKDVDLAESFLCGYLRIQGLTDDHPTLTTFFEGEIIGPKHLFRTTHASWNSSEKIDLQHWARFPAWRPLAKSAKASSSFTLKNHLDREHLFMRWKEYFLVPDHRVKSISGASFEGFYYICFDQRVGSVSGIYFHAKSEKYQQLELRHVDDGGCIGAVEFR